MKRFVLSSLMLCGLLFVSCGSNNQGGTTPNELCTTEEQFMGKTFQVNRGILSYHNTTSGNIRYQLVINDMTQLVCVG